MGLEITELILELEERYGLAFTESDGKRVRTVGDLVEVCRRHILWSLPKPCPSVASALALRHVVREVAGDSAMRIRTQAKITDVLSPAERRELWKRLPELFGEHDVPSLRRPLLVRSSLYVGYALGIVGVGVVGFPSLAFTLLFIVGIAVFMIVATRSFRESTATFGALIGMIVKARGAENPPASANPEALFLEVRQMVAEIMDIRPEDVSWNDRLVEDLGMG